MKTSPAVHGGGILLLPTPKSHLFPFQQLHNSAVPKLLLLHPLNLCRSRRWDSSAETLRTQNFNFNDDDDDDDGEEEEEDFSDFLDEFIDSIWILKVFESYGWALPPIILSFLINGGLKAFLMALALPMGQSVFTFAFQKLWGMTQSKPRRKNNKKSPPRRRAPMDRRGRKASTRKGKAGGYRSWKPKVDVSARIDQEARSFGGWDELDQGRNFNMPQPSVGPSRTPTDKGKLNRNESENGTSLLLRLLIAIFPFLSSWTKML